jgi:hypothetical protein
VRVEPGRTLALAALLATLACARGEERSAAPSVERPAAVVAGRPVPREWVLAAQRSEGGEVDAALQQAVATATLGELARRRGWGRETVPPAQRRSVLVRTLLERRVEVAEPPTEQDRADLERAFREHETWFVHPELRTVEHLVIVLDPSGGRGGRGQESLPPETWEAARKMLAGILPLARGAGSAEAFAGLQPVLERRWREAWTASGGEPRKMPQARTESIGPFDLQGPYDPAFVAAAFALPQEGDVSPLVRTTFGWHLLYLRELQPPRSESLEQALPEVLERSRTLIESQRAAGMVREASGRLGVQVHPELLPLTIREAREAPAR